MANKYYELKNDTLKPQFDPDQIYFFITTCY